MNVRSARGERRTGRYLWLGSLALLALFIGVARSVARPERSPVAAAPGLAEAKRGARRSAAEASDAPRAVELRVPLSPVSTAPRAEPTAPAAAEEQDDGVADEPRQPHPITPAHERIFRENNLLGALNDAMDREDVARLRRLNAEYRADYPEDAHMLQEGYDLIADCLEHPTDETEAAGRRFWQEHRASILRRYVRRHCFTHGQF